MNAKDIALDNLMNPPAASADVGQPLVELRDVTVRFGRQTILNKINITIPRGETLAVIGESGCGKTMLLKIIVGLARPTSGQVIYDGEDLTALNEIELLTKLRRKFGFVFRTPRYLTA